jgi:hypothetical protein
MTHSLARKYQPTLRTFVDALEVGPCTAIRVVRCDGESVCKRDSVVPKHR